MADFNAKFKYDSDFSRVTADIKALVREATNANSVFAQLNKTAASVKMEAARTFSAQAGFAGFKTQIVDLTGATEQFGQQLMKNKLTMKEYFSEAARAYKKDSKARALAEREVRRAQSTVVGMGDVGGQRKGILVTPQALNMKNSSVQLQVASKQYEIFNHLVNQGSTALINWGKNTQWAGRQLTVGLTVPMGIFTAQALKAFAGLDEQITRFRKVYGSDLTGTVGDATDQMVAQIRGLGSEFAKQYGIASKETMALAADLAAAGLEGEKLANAVNQTTRMMVLGEVDRQEAMKATLSIQTAFNQSSKELAKSVDFLNAVENQTSASLQDLVEAIPKTGPVIQALGGDIKDLSILMTAMREGGINAAEGANALKSGMASLISPTSKAIDVAGKFGINLEGIVSKNKGQLMPLLLDFQQALRGLDDFGKAQLIEEIFGKYQFARISALFDNLNAQGSQTVGMVKLLKASSDDLAKKSYSELKAQENAPSTRLAAMQQQLQEQLIKVGADLAETLLPVMQGALDILSKIVDGFNNLPAPIKNFAKIIGGITAAAGPILMLAGIFGNLIGNAIKFGMSIVNMFKKMTGHPVKTLQILSDQEMAAKIAADQLTGAYHRQKTSVMELNTALDLYIANLREAATIAPPGAVVPGRGRGPIPPIRRKDGGVIYAQNGVDSGGRINGYGGGDTVPALLEPGEFVINKQSSQKYGTLLRDINQGKNIPGYQDGFTPVKEFASITDKSQAKGGFGGLYGDIDGKTLKGSTKQFEYQMSLMTQEAKKALENLGIASTGSLKEWAGSASQAWAKSGFDKGVSRAILPEIPANVPDSLKSLLKSFEMFAEIDSKLTSIRGNKSFNPAWAASHMAGAKGQFIDANGRLVFTKEFIATTGMEPQAYNGLINSLGGTGGQAQTVEDRLKLTAPKLERLRDLGFSDSEIKRATSMLAGTEAPVTKEETNFMKKLLKAIDGDAVLRENFNINGSAKNSAQLRESLAYLDTITNWDDAKFASFREESIIQATMNSISDKKLESLYGTTDRIKIYEKVKAQFSELGPLIKAGNPQAIREFLISKSTEMTGRQVVTEKAATQVERELLALQKQYGKAEIVTEKGVISSVVGGTKFSQEKAVRRLPSGVAAEAVEPFKTFRNRRGQLGYMLPIRTPRGTFSRFIKLAKGGQIGKNGSLIKGYAGGGAIGNLLQIMSRSEQRALPNATEMLQKGFTVDRLDALEVAALRKKQTGLAHDTRMFRGGRYNWDAAEVGQTITIPGSRSWSTREDVADNFRAMNELGAEKRAATISTNELSKAGINPETFGRTGSYDMFRAATNKEEEYAINRIKRIEQIERQRRAFADIKKLEAEKKALMDSLYPSQESTLFGATEPKAFEVANRERQLKELDRQIHSSRVDVYAGRETAARYRQNMKSRNEDPVIFEMVTPQGTQTLPLSDITGRGRSIKGMGQMDEFEHLLTDGTMRIVRKYIDERGVKRIVGEFVDAKRFAAGGQLPGYGGGDKVPALLEPGEFVINKQASMANAPLLEQINSNMVQTRNSGGKILKLAKGGFAGLSSRMGGGMAMGMNAMMLPMMLPMIGQVEGFTGKLVDAGIAIQGFVLALQLASMTASGFGKLGAARTMASTAGAKAGEAARTAAIARGGFAAKNADAIAKKAAARSVKAAGGGKLTQMMAGGSKFAGLLMNPYTIAAVGAIAVIGGAYLVYKNNLEQLKREAASAYQESTEMAKVYNIEIKKTSQALQENVKYAQAYGMASKVTGRGQVDKDYAKAVDKQYTDLITSLKNMNSEEEKRNSLAATYASLITQGFSKKQAAETTAEIARQAKATSAFNSIAETLKENIKGVDDALSVMTTSLENQLEKLTTYEEKMSAISAAYQNIVRSSATNPVAAAEATFATVTNAKGDRARELLTDEFANAGIDSNQAEKIYAKFFGEDPVNFATKKGKEIASELLIALQNGMSMEDIIKSQGAGTFSEDLATLVSAKAAKVALNEDLTEINKLLEKSIDKINQKYDDQIAAIEKDKDAIIDGAEAKKKALEDEAKALQDRGDLIRDNADLYIKMLQKEYSAEQYYQKQREQSLGGLKSLAEGDIFGFLQSQQRAASDAQQFGREQAIQQIEDTRDRALAGIEAKLKINQDAGDKLDEQTQKALEGKDKQIEAINIKRSNLIKRIRDQIDENLKVIANPKIKGGMEALKESSDTLIGVVDDLPANAQKAFDDVELNLVKSLKVDAQDAGKVMQELTNAGTDTLNQKLNELFGFTKTTGNPVTGIKSISVTPEGEINIDFGQKKGKNSGDIIDKELRKQERLDKQKTADSRFRAKEVSPGDDGTWTTKDDNEYEVWVWNSQFQKWNKGVNRTGNYKQPLGNMKYIQTKNLKTFTGAEPTGKPMKLGGVVRGGINANVDSVPLLAANGEFVVRRNVAKRPENLSFLTKLNAGQISVPGAGSYDTIGSKEGNEVEINMPINFTINGTNMSEDDIRRGIYKDLMRAKNSLANTIGGLS